jgi:hypothetical protein
MYTKGVIMHTFSELPPFIYLETYFLKLLTILMPEQEFLSSIFIVDEVAEALGCSSMALPDSSLPSVVGLDVTGNSFTVSLVIDLLGSVST